MEMGMSGIGSSEGVTITSEEFAELSRLRGELRQRRVEDKVKELGMNRAVYRQRLVMRRVNQKSIAPDEDLVAYDAIHKLKNPSGDAKQKINVTDNEIVAYKELDPSFDRSISLVEILDKVKELKDLGKLTNTGDNSGDGTDIV